MVCILPLTASACLLCGYVSLTAGLIVVLTARLHGLCPNGGVCLSGMYQIQICVDTPYIQAGRQYPVKSCQVDCFKKLLSLRLEEKLLA